MGNLRDQLEKAKILSGKESKRLAHEERVERKEKGRETLEQEQARRQQELTAQQAQERERIRREQERLDAERKAHEEAAAARALLADARKPGGTVKWYFQAKDGSLPWLECSPREAQELRAGMVCVVRTGPAGTHTYRLLPTEQARRVAKVLPDAVAWAARGVIA
jgi:predicted phage gp36 major capsid-like protein